MSIIKRKASSEDIVKSVLEFDEVPTEGSHNLVESGAVAQAIGDSGKKITVFEAGERFTNFPTFAQIRAEVAKGKTVVIKTSDDEMWYLIRSNSAYCWFQGASEWFVICVDDSNKWTTPYQYDDFLSSQSHNAVQNSTLYDVIGDVETLLAAL